MTFDTKTLLGFKKPIKDKGKTFYRELLEKVNFFIQNTHRFDNPSWIKDKKKKGNRIDER